MASKIPLVVLFGGRSGEHEVSLRSAASVIRHLDRTRYEVIPVSIDKEGRWQANDLALIDARDAEALSIQPDAPEVRLARRPDGAVMLAPIAPAAFAPREIGLVFPVLHGPLCEDGTLQGLLEQLEVAYVGSGVLGSAIGSDKDVSKRLAEAHGIPVAPYLAFTRRAFERDGEAIRTRLAATLALPVFVKPCNMGSSVGVRKVKTWDALGQALDEAFRYDVKVLVEQGIDAREIEVAVVESDPVFVSVASELNPGPTHEFYSYEAKYLDPEGARVDLPADLAPDQMREIRDLAARTFEALGCAGFARVDFFLDRRTGGFFFNEINTLPGFTSISMYPKMMEASGVPYATLLTTLADIALARHAERKGLVRDFLS